MPLSTMLMLVCAYGGYELIMDAYNIALKEDTVLVLTVMPC